jgi:uncharacterized protein (TIGR03000 family)
VIVFRKSLTTAGVAALAAAGLLLPAAPAWAQQGWPINGDSSGSRGGGGGYGFSSPGYSWGSYAPRPAPAYSTPAYTDSTPRYAYSTPRYSPPLPKFLRVTYAAPESNSYVAAGEVEGPRAAQIDVRLPAGATILFDNSPTSQTGALRHFVSPPLHPDKDYFYTVKVRWQEGGKVVIRSSKVAVHAGDRLNLSFGPRAAVAAR